MVKVAVLSKTEFGYDPNTWIVSNFGYSQVMSDIKDHIKIIDVNSLQDLCQTASQVTQPDLNGGDILDITDVYITGNYVIQAFANTSDTKQAKMYNFLGSQLLDTNVHNSLLLIKRNISGDITKPMPYMDISLGDITEAIRSVFVHSGIIIRSNGSIDSYEYIFDPLELLGRDEAEKTMRYHEFKIFDYIMNFYVNITSQNSPINEKASVIFGDIIKGDVMISLRDQRDSEAKNINITPEMFNMIYDINLDEYEFDETLYKRQFRINNVTETTPLDEFPEVIKCPNFYWLLNKEHYRINKKINIDDNREDLEKSALKRVNERSKRLLNQIE